MMRTQADIGNLATRSRERNRIEPDLLIIPLVCVMFLVVMLLALTGKFFPIGFTETPANSASAAQTGEREISITVASDGTSYLDGRFVTLEQITETLKTSDENGEDIFVRLTADRDTPFQYLVNAIKAIRDAGIERIGIETEPALSQG
jgi:biopolymer transport protein ExbD